MELVQNRCQTNIIGKVFKSMGRPVHEPKGNFNFWLKSIKENFQYEFSGNRTKDFFRSLEQLRTTELCTSLQDPPSKGHVAH